MLQHEDESGTLKVLQELVGKFNKATDKIFRVTMEKLVDTSMEKSQDADEYLMGNTLARSELEKMGEPLSDRRFKYIYVQGVTAEYKDIKRMRYRDPTFEI